MTINITYDTQLELYNLTAYDGDRVLVMECLGEDEVKRLSISEIMRLVEECAL